MNNFALRRVLQRFCVLAVLVTAFIFGAAPTKVHADAAGDCYACDWNYTNAMIECQNTLQTCLSWATTQSAIDACYANETSCVHTAQDAYNPCLQECVGSTYQYVAITYACHQRTPCDNACIANKFSCVVNGGTTCASDFFDCESGCCS